MIFSKKLKNELQPTRAIFSSFQCTKVPCLLSKIVLFRHWKLGGTVKKHPVSSCLVMFDQFREIQSSLDSFEVIWSCQTLQGALRFQGVWQKGKGRLAFTISLWLWATHISAFPTPQFLSGERTAVPHFQLLQAVTSSNDRAPQTKLSKESSSTTLLYWN